MPPFTLLTSHVWTLFSTMIWSHLLFWFEFRLDFYRFSQLFDSLPNLVQLFPKKRQNWYRHSILFPSKSNQNKLKFFVFQALVGLNLAEHHEQSLYYWENSATICKFLTRKVKKNTRWSFLGVFKLKFCRWQWNYSIIFYQNSDRKIRWLQLLHSHFFNDTFAQ